MNIQKLLRTTSLALITLCSLNMVMPLRCEARQVTVDWGVAVVADAESGSESGTSAAEAINTRADALNQAFVGATLEEAFAILPDKMPDKQKAALKKYLSAKAPTLVRGYREESSQLANGQQRLIVDVNVDRQWLMKALQGLGVYYTAKQSKPVPCTFYYVGQNEADKKSADFKKASNYIKLLSTAAGFQGGELIFVTEDALLDMDRAAGIGLVPAQETVAPEQTVTYGEHAQDDYQDDYQANVQADPITEALNAAKMGVDSDSYAAQSNPHVQGNPHAQGNPHGQVQAYNQAQTIPQEPKTLESLRFLLISQGKDAWSAKLQGPHYDTASNGNNIDTVWQKLWPAYLSKHIVVADEGASSAVNLQVWGWSSADGAVVFDKAIRDWYINYGFDDNNLDLLQITMQAGAVKAMWRVGMVDSAKLKTFVSDYASQRRLRFDVAPLAKGLNAD